MPTTALRRTLASPRLAAVLAGLFALAAVAAGCGGGDDSTTTAGTPGQSAADRVREFGLEATSSQAKQAEAALDGYMNARVAGEWNKACSYLAKPIRKLFDRIGKKSKASGQGSQVTGKGCAGFVEESTRKLTPSERADLAKIDVTSVRVEDDRGYIIYKETGGDEASMSLSQEGGEWKLMGIAGTPLS
jgi:hypothetical protein